MQERNERDLILVWLTFIYLMNFEELFVYNTFKQIYEVQKKPLYDLTDVKKSISKRFDK